MKREVRLPGIEQFGEMGQLIGVRFSFAGSAYLNRYRLMLQKLNLTPGQVLALCFVKQHPGCDQNTLAGGLAINKASAMSMINRLEASGYLLRSHGRDRRSRALGLTASGQDAFEQALSLEKELNRFVFGSLDPAALQQFMSIIDEVRERSSSPLPL